MLAAGQGAVEGAQGGGGAQEGQAAGKQAGKQAGKAAGRGRRDSENMRVQAAAMRQQPDGATACGIAPSTTRAQPSKQART